MTTLTRAKLALALIGVVLFAASIRYDRAQLRWVAIAFVAAAWVLRFLKEKSGEPERAEEQEDPPSTPES